MKTTSPAADKASGIRLQPGLRIGYRDALAEVHEEIHLSAGTHYLLGRNGRGKTTLFRTLCGLIKPLGGGFQVEGRCRFLAEELMFDRELNARTILKCLVTGKRQLREALAFAEVIELDLDKPFGKLSTGNKRKVTLLLADFGTEGKKGEVQMLDEPFTGLDAQTRQAFLDRWTANDDEVIRLVSAHPDFDDMQVPSALVICDKVLTHHQNGAATWGEIRTFLN
ncbi:MAG: ATP-binding cassette domain-containing protein [Verrucomicrobiota bacterium JB023]|nr:ATP-binding cassette domain-containing protein [Verrucomicrobiota bacterium JB023]